MIILLILMLWLMSVGLRVTSSGINSIHKINNRAVDKNVDDEKDKNTLKKVNDLSHKISSKAMKTLRRVLDLIRHILTAILPLVLILDIGVFAIVTVAAGGYLTLLEDYKGSPHSSYNTSSEEASGKTKILLVGDSRTVQLGMTVFGMNTKNDTDGLPCVIGGTTSGDYLYSKGSMGLTWMKQHIADIDAQVDSKTSVVINMGVNDCSSSTSADDYIAYINNKVKDWKAKGADVYFVSVNPINDSLARNNGYSVTNSMVEDFNKALKEGLSSDVKYIDTYSEVKSLVIDKKETADGIHYNKVVYEKIKEIIWGKAKSNNVSSGKGVDIIKEAEKYVGKLPYVWGGTSLETGADCSGFICAIYEKFGYNLWENRVTLSKVGKEVKSIDEAQAGDILVYNGHVALYDGNGGRIHAPQTGMMVSHDTNLGNYYAIRRVIE